MLHALVKALERNLERLIVSNDDFCQTSSLTPQSRLGLATSGGVGNHEYTQMPILGENAGVNAPAR